MAQEKWIESIIQAFENLGGEAEYNDLYDEIKRIRLSKGINLTKAWTASVRRTIEDHSSDSDNFKSDDIFKKLGYGHWGLRNISHSSTITSSSSNEELYLDGLLQERLISLKIRNTKLILERKIKDNFTCQACGFSYNKKIVECHHLKPLADNTNTYNSIDDLITLCPNCHALAHSLLPINKNLEDKNMLIQTLKEINKSIAPK